MLGSESCALREPRSELKQAQYSRTRNVLSVKASMHGSSVRQANRQVVLRQAEPGNSTWLAPGGHLQMMDEGHEAKRSESDNGADMPRVSRRALRSGLLLTSSNLTGDSSLLHATAVEFSLFPRLWHRRGKHDSQCPPVAPRIPVIGLGATRTTVHMSYTLRFPARSFPT